MTETAFALLAAWGTPILALATFLSCLAVPVPTSAMMLAAGAFAASGVLALPAVLAAALLGAVAGDQAGYALGRVAGPAVTRRLPPDPLVRAQTAMDRRGGLAVFLSRWLFSPLGPYVNLLAGATRMGWARFTAAGVSGEAVWVALYVGLGAAFADQLAALAQLLADSAGLATSVMVAALTGTALWRRRHRA